MRKFFIRLLCCFVPKRKCRHHIRKKYTVSETKQLLTTLKNTLSESQQIINTFIQENKVKDNHLKRYDFIFSLGRFCHCSALLGENGLKIFNGPWDWTGTFIEDAIYQRIRYLTHGFDNFFNREDFVDCKPYNEERWRYGYADAPKPDFITQAPPASKPTHAPNKDYFNIRTRTTYGHDFHANVDFDQEFEIIRTAYMRRAQRTIDCLNSGNKILLVYMHNLGDQRRNMPLNTDKVLAAMRELRNAYPNTTIDLYMFDHDDSIQDGTYRREMLSPGIIRYISNHYDVFPTSDTNRRHTADGLMMPRAVCNIISQIGLTDKFTMI